MKRFVLILLLFSVVGASAQSFDSLSGARYDTPATGCGSDSSRHNSLSLCVGVAGGYSLYVMDDSPYASSHGYTLQIPLLLRYDLTPHWRFGTGLRYDFNWDPLRYRVASDPFSGEMSLALDTAMHFGTQSAYAFHSYLGVPIEMTWFPVAREHGLVSVSLDVFAAYTVIRYLHISEQTTQGYDPNSLACSTNSSEKDFGDENMLPWKLEVGLTISTDALGLIHGVRFFGNLLPTYREPVSGKKIYPFGMTIYL